MKNHKNILLQYQGGGYDGCIWEWNFCFWDKDGEWHNIMSSGSMGVKTEQDALAIIEIDIERKHYVCDLDDETQVLDFTTNTNADLVIRVQRFLADYSIDLMAVCQECKGDDWVCEMTGINGDLLCADCYREHTCDYCGEYWDDTSDFTMTDDYGWVCEYCYKGIQEDEQEDRNREALEQAKIDGIIK